MADEMKKNEKMEDFLLKMDYEKQLLVNLFNECC